MPFELVIFKHLLNHSHLHREVQNTPSSDNESNPAARMPELREPGITKAFRVWVVGLIMALLFLGWFFSQRLTSQWTDAVDFNGAVWSQAAHNFLRAGVNGTACVPSAFYFGPLPIPATEYYGHHPALLHLEIAALFSLFGEHEWAARSIPIICSLLSAIIMWFLVNQCAGARSATLSTALFATLPMELHYGSMVNFEPCTLMWMLLGLLGLRYWELNGKAYWWAIMVVSLALSMFTSWLGYFLVLLLCSHFACIAKTKHRKSAFVLLAIGLFSVALFLFQIRCVQADAWQELADAFALRFSQRLVNAQGFTIWEWFSRVGESIREHIPPLAWLLAIVGSVRAWRAKEQTEGADSVDLAAGGLHWLNLASFCFLLFSVLYVVLFRNASFIHDYASFYLVVPVSIMGGVGLDGLAEWIDKTWKSPRSTLGSIAVITTVLIAGWFGYKGAQQLNGQAYILETEEPEPPDLVPSLGLLIRQEFSPETEVLCNFASDFCPQLSYYSQCTLENELITVDDWKDACSAQNHATAAVVWMGGPEAEQIVSSLPPGAKREVNIGGIPFCFWKKVSSSNKN